MGTLFRQVAIVGLGLIGGSLGMALRKGRVARKVIGFSRSESTLRRAKARGAIDDGDTELCPDWLGGSDLVVIATPPRAVVPTARRIARITSRRIILTDVASTKAQIVRSLQKLLPPRIAFVGAHPMAGSERSGILAAEASLFRGAVCILTPTPRTYPKALAQVRRAWVSLGSQVLELSPDRHDALVAQISHLPHLAAAALVLSVNSRALPLAGTGFSDATRIALGDPELWRQICLTNRQPIVRALDRLIPQLKKLRQLVAQGRADPLLKALKTAQKKRTLLKGTLHLREVSLREAFSM